MIPDKMAEEMPQTMMESNPWRDLFEMTPRKPLTLRQRLALRRTHLISWLHDRMFGSDYCDHNGCYW